MINKIMGFNKTVTEKDKYFWYTMGTGVFALSTLIMTIVISWLINDTSAGMFSVGLSLAQWLSTIALFEIRTYQVTDVKGEYKFFEYLSLRVLMCIVTFIACCGYALWKAYSPYKLYVVILVCIYKTIEALADAFEGEFQKENRIDMSGKSEFFRVSSCLVVLCVTLIISHNLIISLIAMTIMEVIGIYFLDVCIAKQVVEVKVRFDFDKMRGISLVCAPLALSTFLNNYIINSSKLSVDSVLGDQAQLYYTAVFMPNMVINLFSGIIFKPMQTQMAIYYSEKQYRNFAKVLAKVISFIVGFTLICEIGAYLIGIPVLGFLYQVDLSNNKATLLILLLCGGVNAINIIFYYVLVIMRKQNFMTVLYAVVCGEAILIMERMTQKYGLDGAAEGYLILVCSLCILLVGYILYEIRKGKNGKSKRSV